MLSPFPDDAFLHEDGKFSKNWETWMTKLKQTVNFGQPPSKNTDVVSADGINITSSKMRIQSATAGAITVTANPQISKGYDGQEITLEGLSNTKTVTITNGNGLKLAGGSSFLIGSDDVIKLHYNESKNLWIENSRSNN